MYITARVLPSRRASARGLARAVLQQHAVGQVGQRVVLGQVRHALGQGHGFGHVVQHHHRAGELAMAVGDGAGRFLDHVAVPVAAVQHHAARRTAGLARFAAPGAPGWVPRARHCCDTAEPRYPRPGRRRQRPANPSCAGPQG